MMETPLQTPFSAITFQAAPVMQKAPGRGLSWEEKGGKTLNYEWLSPSESVQWECFQEAIRELRRRNANVFVLLGPYNPYILAPDSRERLQALIAETKEWFAENRLPYFELGQKVLPSDSFADECGHLLQKGHVAVADSLLRSEDFRKWLEGEPP